jgi:hypothetical protein
VRTLRGLGLVHLFFLALLAGIAQSSPVPSPEAPLSSQEEEVVIVIAKYLAASFCTQNPCLVTVDDKPPSARVADAFRGTGLRVALSAADQRAKYVPTIALRRPVMTSAIRGEIGTSVNLKSSTFLACSYFVTKVARTWAVDDKHVRCDAI